MLTVDVAGKSRAERIEMIQRYLKIKCPCGCGASLFVVVDKDLANEICALMDADLPDSTYVEMRIEAAGFHQAEKGKVVDLS